jgi:chemotaxis protein methyltransferase CheR
MEEFCGPVRAGHVEVKPEISRLVEVRRFDLIRERPERSYDLIVCRNVIIYFDRRAQEELLESFAEALAPGGVLVLGKVETLLGPAKERLTMVETRERIYRKVA